MPFIFLLFSVFSTVFLKKPQKCRPEHSRRQRRSVSPGNCISSAERNTSAETVKRRAEKRKIHASGVALHRIPFSPLAVLPAGVRKDQVIHIPAANRLVSHHFISSFAFGFSASICASGRKIARKRAPVWTFCSGSCRKNLKGFPCPCLTMTGEYGILIIADSCRCGGIGRHRGLKIPR